MTAAPQLSLASLFQAFDPHRPVPSITRQTPWFCKLLQFQNRPMRQYFNPSLIDWKGRRFLVTRRRRHAYHPGRNDLTAWALSRDLEPILEIPIRLPFTHGNEHWEDPRALLTSDGRFLLSYSNFITPWRSRYVHQAAAWISPTWHGRPFHPVYGDNGATVLENNGHEKNWLWFEPSPGEFHFVYSTGPVHQVVRYGKGAQTAYDAPGLAWRYGHIRGGTTPVLFDGLYWSFFHSSIDINEEPPRRRYYMGAYAFVPEPPFAPVCMTSQPILAGSEADLRERSAPLCVFPCGLLLEGRGTERPTWLVSLGVNDCSCALLRVPHAELMLRMDSVLGEPTL